MAYEVTPALMLRPEMFLNNPIAPLKLPSTVSLAWVVLVVPMPIFCALEYAIQKSMTHRLIANIFIAWGVGIFI